MQYQTFQYYEIMYLKTNIFMNPVFAVSEVSKM